MFPVGNTIGERDYDPILPGMKMKSKKWGFAIVSEIDFEIVFVVGTVFVVVQRINS